MNSPLLQNCVGARPTTRFEEFFPDGITALVQAREAGLTYVATGSGRLCALNESGDRVREALSFGPVTRLAVADTGELGIAHRGHGKLTCFDQFLRPVWDSSVTGQVVGLAMSAYGGHVAFSTDSSRLHLVTAGKKEVATVDTRRPVELISFLTEAPHLIAAAEFGQMVRYDLKGKEIWNEALLNNVGDLAVSEGGKCLFLAAFNHGVQVYDLNGSQLGSFAIDGIPSRVEASANRNRVAVLTLENRIFWLNFEGSIQWAVDISHDPPQHLCIDPLGTGLVVGTQSGCLLSAVW